MIAHAIGVVGAALTLIAGSAADVPNEAPIPAHPPAPAQAIPEQIVPPGAKAPGAAADTQDPSATPSDKLSRSGGVVKPPAEVDPGIAAVPPTPTPNTMPVIPPPGTPENQPNVIPK